MAIRIDVDQNEQQRALKMGAVLLEDGKTWVIPDGVRNVDKFRRWLPDVEGHYVQRPYFAVRAKCNCWKCGKETPVVGLGAKVYQYLVYDSLDRPRWKREECPILFTEVDELGDEVAASMQESYPFFRLVESELHEGKIWGNCCVHCGVLQEEDGDYSIGMRGPLTPGTIEDAMEIRVVYFKLEFDYFVSGGVVWNELFGEIMG